MEFPATVTERETHRGGNLLGGWKANPKVARDRSSRYDGIGSILNWCQAGLQPLGPYDPKMDRPYSNSNPGAAVFIFDSQGTF